MTDLTCIVVDDEPLAIKMLEDYINRTPFLRLSASFDDPVQALSALKGNPVHLVFLDIQMPDLDGLNLSRMVPLETKIIFTTAFKEYAFESYEVNALDFLLKPIRYHKFLNAAEKAKQWFNLINNKNEPDRKNSSIYIRMDNQLRQVDINDILYVSGLKDYVRIYLKDEKRPLITHLTMKAVEGLLPKDRFMRVHRSYIVALNQIKAIDRNNCIYIADEVIHVTEGYKEIFFQYVEDRIPPTQNKN
ncbi:LytTR family DNA-binding domain-containing protein [Bacteroides sp. 519]|uniref:LytR/AlgR family response regulator transcription factor n=1 Tax=Bacteroides sp. 519 TaxID=2302937 RepID=UPI0013D1FB22|nr:LytTR family DNA-binding domain-containing protein [Bacteroides sp. 519]NDV57055.1 DNA-binding response regulator [Bacteroides sp. 519]